VLEVLGDLAAALAEVLEDRGVDARDVGDTLDRGLPRDADRRGQFGAQRGFVEVAGGFGVGVEGAAVQRGGLAGRFGLVGDDGVGVQLGVSRS
jgi:hypothetical protein